MSGRGRSHPCRLNPRASTRSCSTDRCFTWRSDSIACERSTRHRGCCRRAMSSRPSASIACRITGEASHDRLSKPPAIHQHRQRVARRPDRRVRVRRRRATRSCDRANGWRQPGSPVDKRQGLHDRSADAASRGIRRQRRPVRRGRFHQRHQESGRQEHADLRCHRHDRGARLHRLPQPRRRRGAAERSAGRQSLRGGIRQHPQHHRQAARAGADDAAGHLGRGLLLRRYQAERQACAQHSRSG